MLAYRDKRTPFAAKLLIGLTVGYLMSPIDLIPDFIPVLGLLDDLLIVPALITFSIKLIPEEVIRDARLRAVSDPAMQKRNNWIFAILIILVWIVLAVLLYRLVWHHPKVSAPTTRS